MPDCSSTHVRRLWNSLQHPSLILYENCNGLSLACRPNWDKRPLKWGSPLSWYSASSTIKLSLVLGRWTAAALRMCMYVRSDVVSYYLLPWFSNDIDGVYFLTEDIALVELKSRRWATTRVHQLCVVIRNLEKLNIKYPNAWHPTAAPLSVAFRQLARICCSSVLLFWGIIQHFLVCRLSSETRDGLSKGVSYSYRYPSNIF